MRLKRAKELEMEAIANSQSTSKSLQFMMEKVKLFDIGLKNAVEETRSNRLLTNKTREEGINFYLDPQTNRLTLISGHDKVFEKKTRENNFQE